jgi:hypothetical protein
MASHSRLRDDTQEAGAGVGLWVEWAEGGAIRWTDVAASHYLDRLSGVATSATSMESDGCCCQRTDLKIRQETNAEVKSIDF